MRYIALVLLLANLAYFAWHSLREEPASAPAPAARPLLNTGLTLVAEYEEEGAVLARERALASRRCTVLSGFDSLDQANGLRLEAAARGLSAGVRLTGAALPSRYRVYLPPSSSRAVAAIVLDGLAERLDEAELDIEMYLLTRGPLENAIALGVFEAATAAETVNTQLLELGYEPRIEEIARSDGDILLAFDESLAQSSEDDEWLASLVEAGALERSENLCETIAQARLIP